MDRAAGILRALEPRASAPPGNATAMTTSTRNTTISQPGQRLAIGPPATAAPLLSVVVPIYNEASSLKVSLRRLSAACELAIQGDYELVLVDDGSTDASAQILADACGRDSRLRTITLTKNRGKGAAVRAGMLSARGESVVCTDADLAADMAVLPDLLQELRAGWQVVFTNRRDPASRIAARQPRHREVLGRSFTQLARFMTRSKLCDYTCGLKAFRRATAHTIFERSRTERWAFDVEVAVIAAELGASLKEVPVRWEHRPGSKVRVARAVVSSLVELARISWWRARGAYSRS